MSALCGCNCRVCHYLSPWETLAFPPSRPLLLHICLVSCDSPAVADFNDSGGKACIFRMNSCFVLHVRFCKCSCHRLHIFIYAQGVSRTHCSLDYFW